MRYLTAPARANGPVLSQRPCQRAAARRRALTVPGYMVTVPVYHKGLQVFLPRSLKAKLIGGQP
jgi:hypothetical protein